VKEGFARLAGELGNDQIVGGAKKRREFRGGKGVAGFQGDPLGTREYGAGMIPGRSVSSAKFSGVTLRESQTQAGSSGVMANILPATLKRRSSPHWICSWQKEGEAEFAELIDVHGETYWSEPLN